MFAPIYFPPNRSSTATPAEGRSRAGTMGGGATIPSDMNQLNLNDVKAKLDNDDANTVKPKNLDLDLNEQEKDEMGGSNVWEDVQSATSAFSPSTTYTSNSQQQHPQAHLLFSKSNVYIHTSSSSKDFIPGFLGLARLTSSSYIGGGVDMGDMGGASDEKGESPQAGSSKTNKLPGEDIVLFWIPTTMVDNFKEGSKYTTVESRSSQFSVPDSASSEAKPKATKEEEEEERDHDDDSSYVLITLPTDSVSSLPPSRRPSVSSLTHASRPTTNPSAYAFSLPLTQLYSLLAYPPTIRTRHGHLVINLLGGVTLPGLWFHDDEIEDPRTRAQTQPSVSGSTRPQWGAIPLLIQLRHHVELLKSSLVGNLYLLNPSRVDREVHEIDLGEEQGGKVLPGPVAQKAPAASSPANSLAKGSITPTSTSTTPPVKKPSPYPPSQTFPSNSDLPFASSLHPARTQFLSSFSKLTQTAKHLTQNVLNSHLAEGIVEALPEDSVLRKLAKDGAGPGAEWESRGKRFQASLGLVNDEETTGSAANGKTGTKANDNNGNGKGKSTSMREVAGEYESARVYLARWARVVAEEGERARQAEIARQVSLSGASTPLHPSLSLNASLGKQGSSGLGQGSGAKTELGVFELVKSLRAGGEQPKTTRTPGNPVRLQELEEWHAKGLGESWLRGEVFRRGLGMGETTAIQAEEVKVRKWVWEVLLGVIPWEVGLGESTQIATAKRQEMREQKRGEYEKLKRKWQGALKGKGKEVVQVDEKEAENWESEEKRKEEWHRIDPSYVTRDVTHCPVLWHTQVDCRRTDRTQPIFTVPDEVTGNEEKEGGGAGGDLGEAEEGSQTALNPHTATLRLILMTYHQYSPKLGYVQGMSDLLSPIYVVFEADEAISFWAFVGWMRVMETNFLRDQSGMKAKLSTLQQLIEVMDPQLYRKLVRTDSLNLFFCFRWILIAFKREFKFDHVIRLWDVLFTNYYSDDFVLFIALAVLNSHREVIIRYLMEFDEVLKYANDLSGTIDLQSTMAQAEVLFLSFRGLVEEVDRNEAIRIGTLAARAEEMDEAAQEVRHRHGDFSATRSGRGVSLLGELQSPSAGSSSRTSSVVRGDHSRSASNGPGFRSRRGSDASVGTSKSLTDSVREKETKELVSDELRDLLTGFKDRARMTL